MGKYIDLTGQRFNKLLVKHYHGADKHGNAVWCCHDLLDKGEV
jgi:hypothetical protein